MHVDVNGTRLWFDIYGPALVPDGGEMRQRPTVLLIHGGPGVWDHSYFKPDFAPSWSMPRLSTSICAGTGGRPGATSPRGASKPAPTTSESFVTRSVSPGR